VAQGFIHGVDLQLNRLVLKSLVSGIGMAVFAGLFSLTPMGDRIENQYALGLLYALRPSLEPPTGATVVAIDGQTMAWLRNRDGQHEKAPVLACLPAGVIRELDRIRGPGSLPRSVHACLLKELKRIGFSVVVFDILFSVKGDDEDDMMLASALRDHGSSVILVGFERSVVRDGASEILIEREMKPLELFQQSAASTGAFVVPRSGGPVYGYWPQVPGFLATKSLPEEALLLNDGARKKKSAEAVRTQSLQYLWLYGPPGTIETVSVRDVLSGEAAARHGAGGGNSVAFVGASDPSATNYPDSFPSFIRGRSDADMSGVELAATAYLNLLNAENLRRLPAVSSLLLILLYGAALGYLARTRASYAMIAAPASALLYLAAAAFAFSNARLFLPLGTPIFVTAPTAFLVAIVIRYRFARALIMHLSPEPVARRMLSQASDERDAPVPDEATVVFIDLIGSTAIAAKMPAVDFSRLLNSYHEIVSRAVARHRGFINAFSGDGVMVAFTAKDSGTEHAVQACRAALAVIRAMQEANTANENSGIPPLSMRMGMNSGPVAEGGIGGRDRFNFSVVGDVVNLAAHLEQLGKTLFPGEKNVILVGQATRKSVEGEGFNFVDCGLCAIAGHDSPEAVFRLTTE
jgi:adenylate cyclase